MIEIKNPAPPAPPDPGTARGRQRPGLGHRHRRALRRRPAPVALRGRFPPNPLAGRGHAPNGAAPSERAGLSAWLEPGREGAGAPLRRRTAAVPYGVRVRIRGRLAGPRGRGIGRATLAAIRREPGGPWRAVTGVRTRPDGRFTAFTRIGPSQELRFVYYAYGDSPRGRASPPLRVRVVR